jgi:hypothetical protein
MAKTLRQQHLVIRRALLLCALLASIALIGGADRIAASTTTHCNEPDPSGRLFCVTVEDLDGVSPSGVTGSGKLEANVLAYHFYKLTIENKGGSTLTNGTATFVLTDQVETDEDTVESVNSTAVFVSSASSPFCSVAKTNPNTVTCSLVNIPASTTLPTFVVGYRTSITPDVLATNASISVAFKEGAKQGANPAALTFDESTSLEPDPQHSLAWSPPGQDVSLATSPTFDTQFSVLQYKVPAGKNPFVATLTESAGFVCDPTVECFGELITTDLTESDPTTFSASNLFHLRIAISLDVAPGGNTDDYVVSHQFENGSFEVLTTPEDTCNANPPTADPRPCFIVTKDNSKAKLLIFDIFAFENGGWMPG